LTPSGGEIRNQTEVIVKAYKKGVDGRDELASITRYRIELSGVAPRIDKFTFNRSETADGEVDTVNGRISYPGLPDAMTMLVDWSDGTTSKGTLENREGEFWFSAAHVYSGKSGTHPVGLRFINAINLQVIGSYEIKPALATMLDSAPPQAPDGRRGDAAPWLPALPHQTAARALDARSLKSSDMALMFGAGIIAQQAVGQSSFWLDRSLSKTIRRKQARNAGSVPIAKPGVSDPGQQWLATPYRVATPAIDSRPWQDLDGWLVRSKNGETADVVRDVTEEGADWLFIRG
jgi:hypothetical protein